MPKGEANVGKKTEPKRVAEWRFKLYVAGESARCLAAFANLKRVCEMHLAGNYEIEVIDLQLYPGLAKGDQILAIPSLVRLRPPPVTKIIGDLGNEQRLLHGLEIIVSDSYTN